MTLPYPSSNKAPAFSVLPRSLESMSHFAREWKVSHRLFCRFHAEAYGFPRESQCIYVRRNTYTPLLVLHLTLMVVFSLFVVND